jgi:carbon storage regulator CsrA
MLVLTRKLQQQIKIGERITVTILRVRGNTVRVGIDAPRDVRVVRGELPKSRQPAEATELTPEAVAADAGQPLGEAEELDGASAGPDASGSDAQYASPASAAHLPLRRIYNRQGAAPLKKIVSACTVLART